MMTMYEIKKVFAKKSSKIALLVLIIIMGVTCFFATDVSYVDENGDSRNGPAYVAKLREAKKEWAGPLTEDKIRMVIEENTRINNTPEGMSTVVQESNIAYGWKQGIDDIRDLICRFLSVAFNVSDYYRADSLTPDAAKDFYNGRISLLKEWLADENEAKYLFSEAEKEFLISRYEDLETPLYYDYMTGWSQVFEYSKTIVMLTMLVLSYLVAGIFSSEFSLRADSVFFSSFHGRNKAVSAKIKAGFLIVTFVYFISFLIYTAVVLLYLGADGASLAIQVDWKSWKCFYNITIWQKYLLIALCGYIGCLFMAFLSMIASAKTKSAVFAVMIPTILLFIPSFLGNISSPIIDKILGLLPDRLLDADITLNLFSLYHIGKFIVGAVPVLIVLYTVLTVIIMPVLYQEYRHKQIT